MAGAGNQASCWPLLVSLHTLLAATLLHQQRRSWLPPPITEPAAKARCPSRALRCISWHCRWALVVQRTRLSALLTTCVLLSWRVTTTGIFVSS